MSLCKNASDQPTVTSMLEGRQKFRSYSPTGCSTRFQQASCVVQSGLTSNLGHIACLLVTLSKFRWSRRNHECNEERSRAILLGGASRCASREQVFLEKR